MILQHLPAPISPHKPITIKILQRWLCVLLLPFLLHTAHAQTVSTYAGAFPGFANGAAATARFNGPGGVCADAAGNIYVADYFNNRVRKIDGSGNVTTYAGTGTAGFANGVAATAQFDNLNGVCADAAGNIYVADISNQRIRKIDGSGNVSTYAGSGTGGFANGAAATAQFSNPFGVCADAAGNIYVADLNNSRIRKIDGSGNVSTYAGSGAFGFVNGAAATAQFDSPVGVCADAAGNIYVADAGNNRIRKIDGSGNVTTYAGSGTAGFANGAAATAQFDYPSGVCADATGNIYVADQFNRCIRKIDGSGNVTTYAGSGGAGSADGCALTAQFGAPAGICADAAGNIYVADNGNSLIRKISPPPPPPTLFTAATATPPFSILGQPYTYTFTANGGAPLTFSLQSGALPPGLSLSGTGVLSGTPTILGTFGPFVVQAANCGGTLASVPISITVGVMGITSFTPNRTSPGTTVVITGTGFTGATSVSFGGVPAASFVVNSNTQITAVVGSGTIVTGGAQLVIVSSPAGLSTLGGFFVGTAGASGSAASGVSMPQSAVLGNFSTSNLSFGAPITLSGSGFTGATGLLIGGVPVTNFVVVNDGTITATVGGVPVNDRVVLTGGAGANADMSGLGLRYNRLPPPRIITASPASFPATGEDIPLAFSGADFLAGARVQASDGRTGVSVGVKSVTAPVLETTFPGILQSVGIKTITITNPDGQTTSTTLTVTLGAAPQLRAESLVRSTTASGSAFSVRLVGTGIFRTATAWLNDAPARVTVPSSTEAIVEIPASFNDVGGITLALRLANTDGQSTSASVRINRRPPPTILGVTLQSGGILRVRGINFLIDIRSTLGGAPLALLSQNSDTAFMAQIPSTFRLTPNSPTVSLLVNNSDRQAHGVLLPRSFFESTASFQAALGAEQSDRVWANTASGLEIAEIVTGKHQQSASQELSVYPNPVDGELRVGGVGMRTVRLYDMRGGVVLEERTVSGVVNVSALGAGAYMVVVEAADGRVLRQRMVKR